VPVARIAVLLVHAFVLVPAVAGAECAWVLWSGPASPLAGYASRQECERAANDDHALAQLLSRAYRSPQALQCRPDGEITDTRSACGWRLWKFATPSKDGHGDTLEGTATGRFETRELCERQRSPDVMKRDERELTSCLPETVNPIR